MSGASGWMAWGKVWRCNPMVSITSVMAAVYRRAKRRGRLSDRVAMARYSYTGPRGMPSPASLATGLPAEQQTRQCRGRHVVSEHAQQRIEQRGPARQPAAGGVGQPPVANDHLQGPGHALLARERGPAGVLVAGQRPRGGIAGSQRRADGLRRQLGRAQRREDALAGERIVEAGGVADEEHAVLARRRDAMGQRAQDPDRLDARGAG